MKLRTSYFDLTVFRKNLTRFAPVWGLYTLCLLLGLVLLTDSGLEYWLPSNLADLIQVMPVINLIYALAAAQMLFGDLFNPRMCNALHALPIRREGWFLTNVASGLAFSLVPTTVMALIALPLVCMSRVANAWQIPLLWLLGANLQYLFFFGLAVLCVFLSGSRFAMALLYAIVNFAANLVYWLVDTLYIPMLYGIRAEFDAFLPFWPVGQMCDQSFISMERSYAEDTASHHFIRGEFTLTDSWGYLWLCAALGLILMVLALVLYRKRKLECAGDFIAVKALEPVFLVVYSLVAAAMFQLVHQMFLSGGGWVFMVIGLAVGFFTGRMLLERRVNVFRWKNWAALGVLAGAVGLSLLITLLDPFGIETWMPKAENVDRAILSLGYYYHYGSASLPLTEQEDIENVLYIHEQALTDRAEDNTLVPAGSVEVVTDPKLPTTSSGPSVAEVRYKSPVYITITYELKNGATVNRFYNVWAEDEEGQILREYFSRLYCVTGTDDLTGMLGGVNILYVDGLAIPPEYYTQADIEELAAAIEADCEAGLLAQDWSFHNGESIFESENYDISSLQLDLVMGGFGTAFSVYGDSENTLAWLEEHGILDYICETYYGVNYSQ